MIVRRLGIAMGRSIYVPLLALAAGISPGIAAADLVTRLKFDIPPQQLPSALLKFSEQSGVQVTSPGALIEGKSSPGVVGTFHARDALAKVLKGTLLTYDVVDRNTVVIVARSASAHPGIASGSNPSQQGTEAGQRDQDSKGSLGSPLPLAQSPQGRDQGVSSAERSGQHAAESPDSNKSTKLEEIVVTATKHPALLRDVPLSVSALTAEQIESRGYTQFADYINSIPGVYFQDGGIGNSIIHIRGATESGVGSTVATYFGEALTSVFINNGGKPNLRLVDIDQVEVLRGPQGTLFGADALAGVLRITPTPPDLTKTDVKVGARGFTTAHSDSASYHVEGVFNEPLIQDRLALRLVAYKDDIAGYIDNVVPDQPAVDYSATFGLPSGALVTPAVAAFREKDINREQTWGTRATLRWQPIDRLRIDLNYTLQDARLESEPYTHPPAGPYDQQRALDVFMHGGYGERVTIATLTGSYDWEHVSLVSISNWMRMRRFANQDITFLGNLSFGAPIPWSLNDASLGRVFTQEVRLQSRGEAKLQWTVGGFYLHQDGELAQFIPDFSCPLCLPTVLLGQSYAFNLPNAKFLDQKQRAVFGEASYEILPGWTFGAGARYLTEDIDNLSPASDGLLGGGPTPATPPVSGSVHELNPSGYIRYKPSRDITLYAQAARGFRSSDTNGPYPDQCRADVVAAGVKPLVDPDTLTNYELGLKSFFAQGKLSINTSIYKYNWNGVQLSLGLPCGFGAIVNAGDIDGRGVEIEMLAQPTPAWQFNLSLAYNRNHFKDVRSGTGFVPGERLPQAPEKNGSAGAQYSFRVSSGWSGFARADFVYVGDVVEQTEPDFLKQGGYAETSARLGFTHDKLEVDLYGENLTDRRGISTSGSVDAGGFQTLVRPRELGVELRYELR